MMTNRTHAAVAAFIAAVSLCILVATGCTATSTTLAIAGSERSDEVRSFVTAEQHRSLTLLLFRETAAAIELAQTADERAAVLDKAWNDRDLFEYWYLQDTLARALHYATVDAKLATSKSTIELIAKDFATHTQAPLQAVDEYAAARLGEALAAPPQKSPAE